MTPKAEAQDSRFDLLKWLAVVALVVVGVVGNQYYHASPILYRVLGLLVIAGVAAFIALQTVKGKAFFILAKEARTEIRKVVWPTRQETTQTTLIVVAVVLVMALLLWGLDWYVVHAYSGYEKHVMRSLVERVKLAGMEDGFGEILVPTEEVVEMRNGQKRKSERKFFPGYVLVQMEMNEGTWHLVKDTPRVMGFIGGTADKPAPITDKEAEAILRRVADGSDKPKPKTL
jgi:preprotein translocase SecE subunit